ncbi:uncharacterized protein C8A04DRAFT_31001 [Dichotomopilus funicola]|uniref:Uncharacterized protein n=1 Tax=Dichotomopilus funicola TaxID=1934379 RepID=A0AAN6UY65_9PEZI|nr:hypothetical protein C8A04DRAFT_31001 [Dichotomopilus funicola]
MKNTKEAADAEQQCAELKRQIADVERQLADMGRGTAEARRRAEPSNFHQILRLAEDELFSRFNKDPRQLSITTGDTEAEGNWCPSKLRRWTVFPDLHSARFHQLEATLADRKLFASIHQMRGASRYISPNGFKHEDDVREFHPTIRRVTYRSAGVGPAPQQVEVEVDEDDMSPDALPNRWGIRIDRQGEGENCFFGKFRVPYQLTAEMLRPVLAEHPGNDFFSVSRDVSPAKL